MKLPRRFSLLIHGDTLAVAEREQAGEHLAFYLAQLLRGCEMRDDQFRSWELKVSIEPDMDQGPEAAT